MALLVSASSGAGNAQYYVKAKDGSIALREFSREDINDGIDDGEKPVVLAGYSEPFDLTSEQYGTRTMVRLLFTVADGEQKGESFTCMYGLTLGAKAKLRQVVQAMIGRELRPAEGVDFDELLGARLIVNTMSEVNAKGYPVVRFVSARQMKQKAAAAPAKAAPAADAELWADDL